MNAEDSIKAGDLDSALSQLSQAVRDNPAKPEYRTFLFQLLCITGQWNRALTQLNVVADMDSEALLMAQTYRELLQCEAFRAEVFNGHREPLLFGEPNNWIGRLLQAVVASANNQATEALAIVESALENVDSRAGYIETDTGAQRAFEWLADADMRLGPVFEMVLNGKFYWVPMDAVSEISFSAPEDLRDLVWLPVQIRWVNEGNSIGFVPTRYPGEKTLSDPLQALARQTQWHDIGGGFYVGGGQRCFATNEEEYSLLHTRKIVFNPSADSAIDVADATDAS